MSDKTAWEEAAESDGKTQSERILSKLARKTSLSLWTYANVFTDEGRVNGKGDGKELCDLLVVFGCNVILFSDKECAFQSTSDISIAWPRWYKSAIKKSIRQLAGAESFLKKFPHRVYIDKECQTRLPIPLPSQENAKYFLVAATRGSHFAARQHFGNGSSGSFILDTTLSGETHKNAPFRIGFPLENRYVHVLDEVAIEILLNELDTLPDLIEYLEKKEAFLQQPEHTFFIPGEEDLLAHYMTSEVDGTHSFPALPRDTPNFVQFEEGIWDKYEKCPQRVIKIKSNENSYVWDRLIDYYSKFIRAGTAITLPFQSSEKVDHELVAREFASQNRLMRRVLSESFIHVVSIDSPPGTVDARIKMMGSPPDKAFVFVSSAYNKSKSREKYRAHRMNVLTVYCHAIYEMMPTLKTVIGIGANPRLEEFATFDFMYVDLSNGMSTEELKSWREAADEIGILRPKTELRLYKEGAREFPLPFASASVEKYASDATTPMNRKQRRSAEKEARRARK